MRKSLFLFTIPILIGIALIVSPTFPTKAKNTDSCTTIQSGTLLDSAGDPLTTGYDSWGYNYQAHLFNGSYCDAYRDAQWCQPYKDISLSMKWNDAWLSNKDCNADKLLDRHYGYPTYKDSGAWLTNHQYGVNEDGSHWSYFVKIIAVSSDDVLVDGNWYTPEGELIGASIWGEFAVVQEISNDTNSHGVLFKGQFPGLGNL